VRKRPNSQRHADETLKLRFGAVVRAFRRRLGVSQEELAWRADIHRTYLADIERGQRNISLSSIVRLVRALSVSLAEFFHAFEEYFQSPTEAPRPAPPNSAHHAKPAGKKQPGGRSKRR
jgi:transcriptional regulator with XRE-family HTH domain